MNNLTPQMQGIVDRFPDNLRENLKGVDNYYHSFLNLIRSHLKTVYGDKAEWEKILTEYEASHSTEGAGYVEGVDDIPEITVNDLLSLRKEEEEYSKSLDSIEMIWNEYMENGTMVPLENDPVLYEEGLKLLGLVPEHYSDSIFSYVVNESWTEEFEKVNTDKRKILQVIHNMISKLCLEGFLLDYKGVGTVITQRRSRNYYRGENAFYGSSKPSLYRENNSKTSAFDTIMEAIRLFECWNFFDQFDVVKRWNAVGAVNYLALSQHYGYPTQMMDITSDLDTALFFACCKYEDGEWKPLTENDFEAKESRNDVERLGGDSRYAVFYVADREIMDIRFALGDGDIRTGVIPIGYQPFMRCSKQYGYMLFAPDKEYDIYKDRRFRKYKIRLNEKMCKDIYEKMDCGRAVYPSFDIPDIGQYINMIKNTTTFTETVVSNETGTIPIDEVRREFKKRGYTIRRKNPYISDKKLQWINKNYTMDKIVDVTKLQPISAPMFVL